MLSAQLPESELAVLVNKIFPLLKKKKFLGMFLYALFVLYLSIPSFQIPLLEYSSFRVTSLMEQRAIQHDLMFYPKQSWINIDKVNPDLLKAILSLEDETFFYHKGIVKKMILQDYINAVEWGNGIFGIKEASEKYFHKEPWKLTKSECARLAAVIPSPLRHSPISNSTFVLRRTSLALNRMDNIILFPRK